jgi:alpha-beta hydrolase superfamily lysophospholipase
MLHFEWESADGIMLSGFRDEPEKVPDAVLCLVHGLGEHAGRYKDLTCQLCAAGIAVLSMDLRGHGTSDGKRGHVAPRSRVLEDIDDLIRKARNAWPGRPVFLMGHSLGGNLVLHHRLAGKEKVAGTVASSPALILANPKPPAVMMLLRTAARLLPALIIPNRLDPAGLSRNRHIAVEYRSDPLVHPYISLQAGVDMVDAGNLVLARAAEPGGPVLLLHGSADPICSVEGSRQFARAAGDFCAYQEFEGMYHELHHESIWPEEARRIAAFVLSGGH